MRNHIADGIAVINTALLLQIVPYVVAVKRVSLFFTILFGALFFRERHVINKSVGAMIMLLGVVLALVF